MPFPDPKLHDSWESWAGALLSELGEEGFERLKQMLTTPQGYAPVWRDVGDADPTLYRGNPRLRQPQPADAFQVERTNIADAAIGRAQIDDLAVGTAQIDELAVTSGKILSLVVDKIASGQLDATIDVADGKFVFEVGGSKFVLGNGFGSSAQFFLWYGPAVALADMKESNSIVHLKTNGDAYFGGSLSAGLIRNAARTSDLTDAASITIGPFGTLGGTRVYIASYSYFRDLVANEAAGWTISGNTKADLVLEKFVGPGWDELYRTTITGSYYSTLDTYQESMSGSFTITDTSGTTADLTLRARIENRELRTVGPDPSASPSWEITFEHNEQWVSVQSTEE